MKVKYLGETNPLYFTHGKVYEVLSIEAGAYRIIDETGYDPDDENDNPPGYLFSPKNFEIVSGSPDEYVDEFADENDNK